MCGGPEQSNAEAGVSAKHGGDPASNRDSSFGTVGKAEANGDASDSSSFLLELAANNDLSGFRRAVEEGKAKVDAVGSWYGRQNGTSQMVMEQRTPAMIAALYGSVDVLTYILSTYTSSGGDIDQTCGTDGSTALHCAAAGGSICVVETAKLLVDYGAKLETLDVQGRRPADVIGVSPRLVNVKVALEEILKVSKPPAIVARGEHGVPLLQDVDGDCFSSTVDTPNGERLAAAASTVHMGMDEPIMLSASSSPSVSPGGSVPSPISSPSPSPPSSPKSNDAIEVKGFLETVEKARDYPIDPSLPDIKNSVYMTDEFRMFSFKVRPCSRAYSHDWTECPFAHPGENARRRDPRRYHYSCVPCPDFRKGACRRGDTCEYAHGVFECWLHPAQYRTRLCKDGTGCTRRVCFFAHTTEELRPLYGLTGSAVPSPRSTTSLDMAAMSPPLAPGSPSSVIMMPPFSPSNPAQNPSQGSLATPPMSPSLASANSLSGTWSQSNIPALHLPGVSLQASRLRAALNAWDMSVEDLTRATDIDGQLMNELTSISSQALSTQARLNAAVAASACGTISSRAGKYKNLGLNVSPTNLEELFASEIVSSPRSVMHDSTLLSQMENQLQSHKSAHIQPQLQNQAQSQINSTVFPQVSAQMQLQLQQAVLDSQLQGSSLLQSPMHTSSFSLGSLGRMSALGGSEIDKKSSNGTSLSPAAAAARAAFAQRDKRSHSSRDLGAGLPLSDWGSPTGKPEWGVKGDDLAKFRKSASFGFKGIDEPDLSWVQKLVKEGPLDPDAAGAPTECSGDGPGTGQRDGAEHSGLGSWIEKLQLDQIVA